MRPAGFSFAAWVALFFWGNLERLKNLLPSWSFLFHTTHQPASLKLLIFLSIKAVPQLIIYTHPAFFFFQSTHMVQQHLGSDSSHLCCPLLPAISRTPVVVKSSFISGHSFSQHSLGVLYVAGTMPDHSAQLGLCLLCLLVTDTGCWHCPSQQIGHLVRHSQGLLLAAATVTKTPGNGNEHQQPR